VGLKSGLLFVGDEKNLEVMCDEGVARVKGTLAEDQYGDHDEEAGLGGVVGEEGEKRLMAVEWVNSAWGIHAAATAIAVRMSMGEVALRKRSNSRHAWGGAEGVPSS
jgi:hypothetical protein